MTIKKILNKELINIHYDSKTNMIGSRSYLHARDVADALLFLLKLKEVTWPSNHTGGKCPKFNISSDEEFDNLEIAMMIAECMNVPLEYKLTDPNIERPGHDMRYLICGDYMRSLGWKKKMTVREQMKKVVEHTVKGLKNEL
jgi:dTDP-glucose 4,6-dehydratase